MKESCEEGFKNFRKLEDYDNHLCLPKDEECPINDIISSDIELPGLISDGCKSLYMLDLTENVYLDFKELKEIKKLLEKKIYYFQIK